MRLGGWEAGKKKGRREGGRRGEGRRDEWREADGRVRYGQKTKYRGVRRVLGKGAGWARDGEVWALGEIRVRWRVGRRLRGGARVIGYWREARKGREGRREKGIGEGR